jgi:hypothetical protein
VPPASDAPYWEAAPEYRLLTLQGYPVVNHMFQPQIYVYPTGPLGVANPYAGEVAADLETLLQTHSARDVLPFLPLINSTQAMHAKVRYLAFKSGEGVRFLTELDQGPVLINNYELIYTFQGLTEDGEYYVAAILPVNHPDLPDGVNVDEQLATDDFRGYIARTVEMLDRASAEVFTPDLRDLDALIQSIEIE